jgi:hypothetical protein
MLGAKAGKTKDDAKELALGHGVIVFVDHCLQFWHVS